MGRRKGTKSENNGDGDADGDEQKVKKEENTAAAPVTVVLKVDTHCDGCSTRIVRLARRLEGVETVKLDQVANKLTVIGFVDPSKIREQLQKKGKKKVELISPQPKKETTANNDNNKKPDNQNPTKATVTTTALKLSFHCEGCITKIHKTLHKTKGVYEVTMDRQKEQVTVTGTADVKSLTEILKRKLKRDVEVVPPPQQPTKKEKERDGVDGDANKKKDSEGVTRVGSPGRPGFAIGNGYGYGYGLGPYGYFAPAATEIFSEESPSGCHVM